MTPRRVLLVFTILNRGGAETMAMNYYRHIDRNRLQFDFLVHREEPGVYEEEIRALGGRIFRLPPISLRRLGDYRKAVAAFFDAHPEYELVHGHCSELGYWIYREAARRKLPFIAAHAHSSPHGIYKNSLPRFILKRLMRPYLTHRFTCSERCGRWLFGRKGMRDAVVVRNAIDVERFRHSAEKRAQIRRDMGWEDRLVVGHVGNFSWPKNHDFLLRVFAELQKSRPDALLVLIGTGGEHEPRIRAEASRPEWRGSVRLLGGRNDIPDLMQGLDVFAFPSLFEGFSVAMLEAQAAGLPIVASDRVPSEGAVAPDGARFLSLKESPALWAEALAQRACTDSAKRAFAADAVRNAGFDITANAARLQKIYLEQEARR